MTNTPVDQELYNKVKREADKKFLAPTSIYKSAWITREYKKRGGLYKEDRRNPNQGLLRWFHEKWVNLNKPIKDKTGKIIDYEECGRDKATTKGTYPLCRPLHRITKNTPKTVSEIPSSAIEKAKREKQKVKQTAHIKFENNKKDNKK